MELAFFVCVCVEILYLLLLTQLLLQEIVHDSAAQEHHIVTLLFSKKDILSAVALNQRKISLESTQRKLGETLNKR